MAPRIRKIQNRQHYVDFFGRNLIVTVTQSPLMIHRWISTVRFFNRRSLHRFVVGVGVRWTPVRFHPDPPPDVLHLCVGNRCLIIQLNHCNRLPIVLRRFLADRRITFVGVWNYEDKRKLEISRHQLMIWRVLDIRHYLVVSLQSCSFEENVKVCFGYEGVRLDPEISRSDLGGFANFLMVRYFRIYKYDKC